MILPVYYYIIEISVLIIMIYSLSYIQKKMSALVLEMLSHIRKKHSREDYEDLSHTMIGVKKGWGGLVIESRMFRAPEKLPHDKYLDARYKEYTRLNRLLWIVGIITAIIFLSRAFTYIRQLP